MIYVIISLVVIIILISRLRRKTQSVSKSRLPHEAETTGDMIDGFYIYNVSKSTKIISKYKSNNRVLGCEVYEEEKYLCKTDNGNYFLYTERWHKISGITKEVTRISKDNATNWVRFNFSKEKLRELFPSEFSVR